VIATLETGAMTVHGLFVPTFVPASGNQIPISALNRSWVPIMWISVWAVTIALAIGFSVMAVAMQSEKDHAALGR